MSNSHLANYTVPTHINASQLTRDDTYAADICIVGTGAGGATAAAILAERGFSVMMVEAGPYQTKKDFDTTEPKALATLYQEMGGRKTKDKNISIYQGRSVGGSTTVNWTTSFRTPAKTLEYWRDNFGTQSYTPEALAPYFDKNQTDLNISTWKNPANANNQVLERGGKKLGWDIGTIARNVRGCGDLGYCGTGCPINAKQSMLVTRVPQALKAGAKIITHAEAWELETTPQGDKIHTLLIRARDANCAQYTGVKVRVQAKHFIVAGGAINSPGLLLRSQGIPDPYHTLGKRSFLHPVTIAMAVMQEKVEGWHGAPQSRYSDEFLWTDLERRPGYKIEVPPLQPILGLTQVHLYGKGLIDLADSFPYLHGQIALIRDGFHEQSQGGTVELNKYHQPVMDYVPSEYLKAGFRDALTNMTECTFAAGAKQVMVGHSQTGIYTSFTEAKQAITQLSMDPKQLRLVSAHVMGGCAMGADEKSSVVNEWGLHHQMSNLSVMDGSIFPTSLGVNPQWTIFGIVSRMAEKLTLT